MAKKHKGKRVGKKRGGKKAKIVPAHLMGHSMRKHGGKKARRKLSRKRSK